MKEANGSTRPVEPKGMLRGGLLGWVGRRPGTVWPGPMDLGLMADEAGDREEPMQMQARAGSY